MTGRRNTDKYRKRMKQQKASSIARKHRKEFEACIWHQHLAEQHKLQEQAAKALRNERQDLVNHLSSLFWLRYYQQDPEKARAAYELLELKQVLKVLDMCISSISFGDGKSEPIDPLLSWEMYQW